MRGQFEKTTFTAGVTLHTSGRRCRPAELFEAILYHLTICFVVLAETREYIQRTLERPKIQHLNKVFPLHVSAWEVLSRL